MKQGFQNQTPFSQNIISFLSSYTIIRRSYPTLGQFLEDDNKIQKRELVNDMKFCAKKSKENYQKSQTKKTKKHKAKKLQKQKGKKNYKGSSTQATEQVVT